VESISSKPQEFVEDLFGHSLGNAVAAIASMELHDIYNVFVNVKVVVFHCPSLIRPKLREHYECVVMTVIHDANLVPRLS